MNNEKKSSECGFFSQIAKNPECAAQYEKYCGKQISGRSNSKNIRKKFYHRHILFGVLFIAIGIFWYAKAAGLLPDELLTNFWPVIFTGIGLWIIVKSSVRQKKYNHNKQ
jgi:hypothetical protein